MRIELQNTPDQEALVRAMGSKNRIESLAAQQAFAAAIGPVIGQVLQQAGSASMIYKDFSYDEDDSPSVLLDLYFGADVGTVTVWSQNIAGGLGTSHVSGMNELKFADYTLDSAVNLLKRYARKCRLDAVGGAINRMTQEVLVKQERSAWVVILRALGEAATVTDDIGTQTNHTIVSTTQNVLQLDDFNRLLTLGRRLNTSFAGGTPVSNYSNGTTDIILSPEMMEQVRAFCYQPMNTRVGTMTSSGATAVPLPDAVREKIFAAAGASEIFGKTLHELLEFGLGRKYNVLFGDYAKAGIAAGSGNFAAATDEIVLGIDLTRDAFQRGLARGADKSGSFTVEVDDQWAARTDKMGWFGGLQEGRICLDARAIDALIV